MSIWNPWHGCTKISPGCLHCYVYRRDASVGRDAGIIQRTKDFDLPIQRIRSGEYKLAGSDAVFTCMTSDFFLEAADDWRPLAWQYIRTRSDLHFIIITKRIDRFSVGLPEDWGEGYPNVTIGCTCENQERADGRLPFFLKAPIAHRILVAEPFLEPIQIHNYLKNGEIEQVLCGGESGDDARPLHYEWVLNLREQCMQTETRFSFRQTGAVFIMKGKTYHIDRKFQLEQANKANLDYIPVHLPKDCINSPLPMDSPTSKRSPEPDDSLVPLFERLRQSRFRSQFHLRSEDFDYIARIGMTRVESHARDFVRKKLSPAAPLHDGKQTPMRGHPVFIAQHATACCCRECLRKWHHIQPGKALNEAEQNYIVRVLMTWIHKELEKHHLASTNAECYHISSFKTQEDNHGTHHSKGV